LINKYTTLFNGIMDKRLYVQSRGKKKSEVKLQLLTIQVPARNLC